MEAKTLEALIAEKTNSILNQVDGLTPAIVDEIFEKVKDVIKNNLSIKLDGFQI